MLLTLLVSSAQAFCGTYVGQAGSSIYNSVSTLAIARQGTRTTLTLSNDFEGDASDFAMLIPVPEVLGPEDVSVVGSDVVGRLDQYSAPRLVSYTCEDLEYAEESYAQGCGIIQQEYVVLADGAGMGIGEDADDSVTVEATFAEGDYEIVILSAEESGDLMRWLSDNGYELPAGAGPILQEYIDSGSFFFAAKVRLGTLPEGKQWLSPLQFGYDSEFFGLPIRIGTASSSGIQDLIVFAVTRSEDGEVGIANYPEVQVEQECMYDSTDEDFGTFYNRKLTESMEGGAAWVKEYSWAPYHCDPCPAPPLTDADLQEIGFEDSAYGAHFTRLHVRYSPEAATQDLVFYTSGGYGVQSQVRYITYDHALEEFFPVCDLGWSEEPGTCEDAVDSAASKGCSVSVVPFYGIVLAGGALALWRRRQHR
jgi:hypothetical protein